VYNTLRGAKFIMSQDAETYVILLSFVSYFHIFSAVITVSCKRRKQLLQQDLRRGNTFNLWVRKFIDYVRKFLLFTVLMFIMV